MATSMIGAAAALDQGALGTRRDPYTGFSFLVEFEGLVVGGFSAVSGLQIETVVERYREGGINDYEHQLVGPTRHPAPLVLTSGVTDLHAMWGWYEDVRAGKVERRNGSIYLLDRGGQPAMWWDVAGACPVKWSGPNLQADSSAVAVESIELTHRGISRPAGSRALSTASLLVRSLANPGER